MSATGGSSGAPNVAVHLKHAIFLFKSDFIFTTMDSSGARVREVQMHQTRQFTLNMLEFLLKSYLIFPLRAVQEHKWYKFRRTKCGSST
jgi:hypothetical protein